MNAQEILSTLQSYQSSRSRRRLLLASLLVSIGYLLITWSFQTWFSSISQAYSILLDHQLLSSRSPPPLAEHLVQTLTQRHSSYRSPDSLLPVSAIIPLRNWHRRRIDALELLLRLLVNYPYIREIIVWNDDVTLSQANLNVEDLISRIYPTLDRIQPPILRVINSPGGMREMSTHMACSLAKYDTCYHSDGNRLNLNLDTLYTKYLESNGQSEASIVDHASPEEYSAEASFDVFQPDHSLHSGIVSQLSRGSLAAKFLSTRYFQQLTTTLVSNHDDHPGLKIPPSVTNDIQFSIWSNRRPLKLVTPTQALVHINPPVDPLKHLDPEFIHRTYQKLNETIRSSDPFLVPTLFPRASASSMDSKRDSEIGVASAYDDRSMLITSLDFSLEWPFAVDGELSTCWRNSSPVEPGGFVGLNFVNATRINRLIFFGSLEAEKWKLEVYSADQKQWNATLVVPTVTPHQEPPVTKYVFDLSKQPSREVKKVRLLRMKAPIDSFKSDSKGFTVCGWMINEDWIL